MINIIIVIDYQLSTLLSILICQAFSISLLTVWLFLGFDVFIFLFFMKGKKKLASLVPPLIHDILLNEKRGIPLRIEVGVNYKLLHSVSLT